MPKLNAVAMVVLTLGVIGGTGYVVLRRPGGVPDPVLAGKHLRDLGDRDPDVSQEARSALRSMGPRALPALEEASRSGDRLLAERARKLLEELRPSLLPPAPPSEGAPAEKAELLEFVLESRSGPARAGDLGALWVQLRNGSSAPVLVARGPEIDPSRMAVFEIEDGKGQRSESPAEVLPLEPADREGIVVVRPGETAVLFQGGPALVRAVSRPGTYTIRFVYDATEGSAYRKLVRASDRGVLLPPSRLVSGAVTVTVAD